MNRFRIGWLFPDTLYLHGERGNVLAFKRFSEMAGMKPEIDMIDYNTEGFEPEDYQLIFCPTGEITSFPSIIQWMKPYKDKFTSFVERGSVLIATGTSVSLWCEKIVRTDGQSFPAMGILNAQAMEKEDVYGDDNYFKCRYGGQDMEIIGNQIQMVEFISGAEEPFGKLIYGYGNSGIDRQEGFIKNNSIFTNSLGPVFVTNPWLTIEVIKAAAKACSIEFSEINFDSSLERKSFETKKEFILTKESRLTNCK